MAANFQQRLPIASIALLSGAVLAYELLLMRLLSIIQWHHFAYMIISLALLGYGASGSFTALFYRVLQRQFGNFYTLFIGLFAVSSMSGFLLAQQLPFNPEELFWDPKQPFLLLALYLLLALPFFFAASAIAMALSHYRSQAGRLYAADLFGAGLGGLAMMASLFYLMPLQVLSAIYVAASAGALLAVLELRIHSLFTKAVLASLLAGVAIIGLLDITLKTSPYKSLPQMLHISGARIIATESSPLGLLSVVESNTVPLRHAPGLSLNAHHEPPAQLGVFTDADNMTVINQAVENIEELAYLGQMPSALPYHLRDFAQVLVLGAGGGAEVLQALYHKAAKVTAVELNPQLAQLLREDFGDYSGHLYARENVELHIDEARGYVTGSRRQFDLIQLSLFDAFAASSSGLYALNESYLYTVEALQTYLQHVSENGYLAISRWIKLPPRDTLKLAATAIAALEAQGVEDAGNRLMLIRGWQTSTLLIKQGQGFTMAEIAHARAFAEPLGFDMAWYPGMPASEANRFNRLRQAYFYQSLSALLDKQQRTTFLHHYKYNLQPATDEQPYFFHFFKWRLLPELIALDTRAGLPLLEWGYLILLATLLQAVLASIVLILAPLGMLKQQPASGQQPISKWRVLLYFLAIGLGFLFIEIAFIQKFILLLHHPLYAAAVVITAFLVFAALGSLWSQRLADRAQNHIGVISAVTGIALMCLAILLFFRFLPDAVMAMSLWQKIPFAALIIAPLAFLMGMPFPLALSQLGAQAENLMPWAWGINGCASVISAVLATLLAIEFGFSIVVLIAVALYFVALLSFPKKT